MKGKGSSNPANSGAPNRQFSLREILHAPFILPKPLKKADHAIHAALGLSAHPVEVGMSRPGNPKSKTDRIMRLRFRPDQRGMWHNWPSGRGGSKLPPERLRSTYLAKRVSSCRTMLRVLGKIGKLTPALVNQEFLGIHSEFLAAQREIDDLSRRGQATAWAEEQKRVSAIMDKFKDKILQSIPGVKDMLTGVKVPPV